MPMSFVNVKLGDETIGTIHLLGSEVGSNTYLLLLRSTGVIEAFASICEGVFDSAQPLADENGNFGNVLIGKVHAAKDPAKLHLSEKVNHMNDLARKLGRRVEAQRRK